MRGVATSDDVTLGERGREGGVTGIFSEEDQWPAKNTSLFCAGDYFMGGERTRVARRKFNAGLIPCVGEI